MHLITLKGPESFYFCTPNEIYTITFIFQEDWSKIHNLDQIKKVHKN